MRSDDQPPAAPEAIHQQRAGVIEREIALLERTIAQIAYSRLASFLLAATAAAAGVWWMPQVRGVMFAAAALLLVVFVALVVRHSRVEERRDHARERLLFTRESIAAIHRAWDQLPPVPAPVGEDHPYALDLDLAGEASLFQLVDRGATPFGRATLQGWLLAPAPLEAIARRQAAVRALARDTGLREELTAWARLLRNDPEHLTRFLAWAEGEPWLLKRPMLLWTTRVLTVVSVVSIALAAAGLIETPIWIATATASGVLTWACRHQIQATFDRAADSGEAFRRYARLLDRAARVTAAAPLLDDLRARLHAGAVAASAAVRRFTRAADRSNLRYSAAVFHVAIQATTFWDFHALAALESWQQAYGRRVRPWLQALGELEAIVALAGLCHDNPSFQFPELVHGEPPLYEARGIGHPLIAGPLRVVNDVSAGPPGTFLLITGSNMSGKSTLLRAIGLNAVLAQAGAPVCAAALRMPAVRVYTSMRVHDSLAQGVSYFMAALTRLKQIVDASRDADPPLLYLLDEVLQGTNSAERQIAVRRIVGFLLEQHAIGAVTTHDLDLAATGRLASAARMVHFSEGFQAAAGRETMYFDYVLRPGIATSRNALKLMEMVGLPRGSAQ